MYCVQEEKLKAMYSNRTILLQPLGSMSKAPWSKHDTVCIVLMPEALPNSKPL